MVKSNARFEDEESFRQEVEKESMVSLTDVEWSELTRDCHAPYDSLSFTEMVNAVRSSSARRPKSSAGLKARSHRVAHVERAGQEAKQITEDFRQRLFGQKHPPFPNQAIKAAEWIESLVEGPSTGRLTLEVTIPAELEMMESLVWLRDYLTQNLGQFDSSEHNDGALQLNRFQKQADAIRSIQWGVPILSYLGMNPEGEFGIKRVHARDGTLLGSLQDMGEQLAEALDWTPHAAVHHLLTGGVVSSSGVQATTRYRAGRKSFGDSHPMTMTVSDPESVTARELIAAFQTERSEVAPPWQDRQVRRASVSSKSERVAAYVAKTPKLSWANRFKEWNLRNPEDRFRTLGAIKQAYYRARGL